MARFLSPQWFEEATTPPTAPAGAGDPLILEQVVKDTPDGEVRYFVVAHDGVARIEPPGSDPGPPHLTITTDWETASAIARGELAAQSALVEGRLRVRGNLAVLAGHASGLAGLDAVPAAVRETTTY